VWPERSSDAQYKSLCHHTQLGEEARRLAAPAGWEGAIERAVELYPSAKPEGRFWTPTGDLVDFSQETFLTFMREVSWEQTSPGQPWRSLGCATVGETLDLFGEELYEIVRHRLRQRVRLGQQLRRGERPSAADLVEFNVRDVVRVFVKNEPHSESKARAERWRLIMNSGLADIACDRVAFENLAETEIEHWGDIPSMPGMGLDDKGVRRIHELFMSRTGAQRRSTDVKAFDFSVAYYMMEGCARVEARQFGVHEDSDLALVLLASAYCTCMKVWALSSGELWAQLEPGIQESGSRGTAFRNSKIRFLIAICVGSEWAYTMGDDCEEGNDAPNLAQRYWDLFRFILEEPDLPEGVDAEFCSTWFWADGRAEPLNWHKTLFRLLGREPDPLEWAQFCWEMRGCPRLAEIQDFCASYGWSF